MQWLTGAIFGGLARSLLDKLGFFFAIKTILCIIAASVMPIILKNTFTWLIQTLHTYITQAVSGYSLEAQVIQLSGLAAYMAQQLQVPLCLSMIITALSIRLIMNFVPFVS